MLSLNNVEAEAAAVVAGIGIRQLSQYMINDALADGSLVAILPRLTTANKGLYMYYQRRTQMPLRVRNFIDFIAEASPSFFPKFKSSK